MEYQIILFYKYVHLDDPEPVKVWQDEICVRLGLTGRCILASEGINATFEGTENSIKEYTKELQNQLEWKKIIKQLEDNEINIECNTKILNYI